MRQWVSVAQIVPRTAAEGPGWRFALWFQGCPLRCPGCCNPEMLPFVGGTQRSVEELVAGIAASDVEGITLLGGEPFAHVDGASALASATQALGKSVMVFSGYTLEQLHERENAKSLLAHTDILVDGPYLRESPDTERRWVGSTNQRIHFLTGRYQADDPRWRTRNTLEIRLQGGELSVNGFPARSAVGLWRRPHAGRP
ncbi:MAG: 4Fe-4S single cluster domain-containing protein [Gemmataceae bacterium]